MARIEDYALIGDLHTAALVGRDGSIDWLCLPRFDSGSCFAALLHDESAGHWRLAPACGGPATRRAYRDDTLIMDTEWDTVDGSVRITDFMPPRGQAADLVRVVEGLSGRVPMRMKLVIRFDYGNVVPWIRRSKDGLIAIAGPDTLCLTTPVDISGDHMSTIAEFEVVAGDKVPFVLTHAPSHRLEKTVRAESARALRDTERFWRDWIGRCSYRGPYQDAVSRAVITLKALTYDPTGGITAAATTSLPEGLGGVRNWDYRYCWLRDATFTLQALLGTGYVDEAQAWRDWLVRAVAGDPAKLQIMYGVDGTRRIPELTLGWLSGYENSSPVRIGNGAAGQFQLDVYGEVLDGLHLARETGMQAVETAWDIQLALLDFLEGNWNKPDSSLWEVRGEQRHFVHSKVMAWAGVDRAVHSVETQGLAGPVDKWRELRERIHADVCAHGYDADRQTFTQSYGARGLDSALLLIPRVGFLPWTDPRVIGTVEAVQRELASDGFLMRYDPAADGGGDGLPGAEGTFLVCTFWLADALHGIGRAEEARKLFERLLSLRNDVGLLSEEYDTAEQRQVGNMPQAFSMVGMVNTARRLSESSVATRSDDLSRVGAPPAGTKRKEDYEPTDWRQTPKSAAAHRTHHTRTPAFEPALSPGSPLGWERTGTSTRGLTFVTTLEEISALTRPNHPGDWTEIDSAAVDTARVLAADAVQKCGSGHPGTAMSLAPLAYTLFQRVMRHDPADTHWLGRDRFILSPGHSCLTLYIQLYLGGFGLELADIEALRTWGSKTPGHPEFRHTRGIEMTTGPLGQGLASSVGMAMAARYERGLFDPDAAPGTSPFDHYIYVIASDGDIEEGVTSEASSIAGVQRLGNLIVFYDHNKISIEDDTTIALCEDTAARYRAYGWHVQEIEGGENVVAIEEAIANAQAVTDRPSFIAIRTIIGYPAPTKMNTGKAHGSALGDDEVAAVKKVLGFDPEKNFQVSSDVLTHTRGLMGRGKAAHDRWQPRFEDWAKREPERKALLDRLLAGKLPDGWDADLPHWEPGGKALATRAASGKVLSALGPKLPELWGGSADLAGSNNTTMDGADSFGPPSISTKNYDAHWYGRTLHFGIREHGMGAILSGIVLHGPTRAYGGTFLQFSDYMRPAVRLAALMDIDTIYVWTHDSIGLGEDGPTHQPIEHLAALRAIPRLSVVRPADANETAHAWRTILARGAGGGPVGLVLTRQGVPVLDGTDADGVARGGYVLSDAPGGKPDVVLVGTGSEVQLAVAAQKLLAEKKVSARVVSMPCLEWFDAQPAEYRDTVLPPTLTARVVVEAGVAQCWHKLVGSAGQVVSIEHFGASADYQTLFREFGFTPEAVVAAAEKALDN